MLRIEIKRFFRDKYLIWTIHIIFGTENCPINMSPRGYIRDSWWKSWTSVESPQVCLHLGLTLRAPAPHLSSSQACRDTRGSGGCPWCRPCQWCGNPPPGAGWTWPHWSRHTPPWPPPGTPGSASAWWSCPPAPRAQPSRNLRWRCLAGCSSAGRWRTESRYLRSSKLWQPTFKSWLEIMALD